MRPGQRALAEGALFTDQYQLTMAQLYFRLGLHERPAQFDYFFRRYPDYGAHKAGYCVFAGLAWLLDWMDDARFGPEEVASLRAQRGSTGQRLFQDDFLGWLEGTGDRLFGAVALRAVPEGRVVHPHTPLAVVQAPLALAQLLESSLLNHLNYQTLVATKAARMHDAGEGQVLLEFGMRRAQDRAATAGARAALIGGADYTSNVGASHVLGLAPKGTHAHSMVQAFLALGGTELDAFRAYADVYPDDCLLLVDTLNTLASGVPNAIRVFQELRRRGHEPVGIRLDSGDLAHLSVQAARMLDAAGFDQTRIVLSNQLDEIVIWQVLTQIRREAARQGVDAEALVRRLVYGVGTQLITSGGAGALDGVYKLVALRDGGDWRPAVKLSEAVEKVPSPGEKALWRLYDVRGKATADLVTLAHEEPAHAPELALRHPFDHTARRTLRPADLSGVEPLLEPVAGPGRARPEPEDLAVPRARRAADVAALDAGVRRLINAHVYHVSLSEELWRLKEGLVTRYRAGGRAP